MSGWRTPPYTPGMRRSPQRVIVAMSAAVGLMLAACGVEVDVSTRRADSQSAEDPTSPDTTDATENTTDDTGPPSTEPTEPTEPTEKVPV